MNTTEEAIKKVVSYIGWLLLLSAFAFYGYGLYEAMRQTLQAPEVIIDYSTFLSATMGSIQALLLTNLGFVLGISVIKPTSGIAMALRLGKPDADIADAPPSPMDLKSQLQLVALIIYVLSLISCLVIWVMRDFSNDGAVVVPLISESAKMFVGVVLAYLSALFSK